MSKKKEDPRLKRMDIRFYLPGIRVLSFCALIAVLVLQFFLPLNGRLTETWSSGPISNAHKMIEADCTSCHKVPFQPVQDEDCVKCHSMTKHSENMPEFVKAHSGLDLRCEQCHMEHNGDKGIIASESKLCTNCHGGMKGLSPDAKVLDVGDLANHPEFRVPVKGSAETPELIALNDAAHLKDTTPLKLNHALHLKSGLQGPKGRVTLECRDCHKLNSDFKTIMPISFDRDCRSCHTLGFDDRLPNSQVPHGETEAVFATIFTEFNKMLALGEGGTGQQPVGDVGVERTRPGTGASPAKIVHDQVSYQEILKDARAAEEQIFTKTGCVTCHEVQRKSDISFNSGRARWDILKPEVPQKWFSRAIFGHGAHEEISCESCHKEARNSSKTTDVLLPGVASCRDCHSQHEKAGFVTSECIMCHDYHDMQPVDYDKKRSVADYISLVRR